MTIENSIHCKVSLTLKWVFFDFRMTTRIEVKRREKNAVVRTLIFFLLVNLVEILVITALDLHRLIVFFFS